jgi:RNA polymerase sigma-70 factor, ECF subfamily
MQQSQTSEQTLVAAMKAGDRGAFRDAVIRYSPRMLARARYIVGPVQAEDVVQDTWLVVFRQIQQFEERAALSTWLERIVSNRAISLLRARSVEVKPTTREDAEPPEADWFDERGRWADPPQAWGSASPEDLLMADALQECIDKHLLLMSEAQRQVVVLRDMQDHSFEAICSDLRLSASNARVLLHRGRMKLMNMVSRYQATGSC